MTFLMDAIKSGNKDESDMANNESKKFLIGRRAKRTSCPVSFFKRAEMLNLYGLVCEWVIGGKSFKTAFTTLCGLKFDSYFYLRA